MSEIRSQATPARDELLENLRDAELPNTYYHQDDGCGTPAIRPATSSEAAEMALDVVEAAGWSKPRTVNSAADLKALPKCSLIRGLEREGQRSGDVFEKVGPDHWLCLDPGDRFDGEETTPSHAIVLIYKAGIRVLFAPGDAG